MNNEENMTTLEEAEVQPESEEQPEDEKSLLVEPLIDLRNFVSKYRRKISALAWMLIYALIFLLSQLFAWFVIVPIAFISNALSAANNAASSITGAEYLSSIDSYAESLSVQEQLAALTPSIMPWVLLLSCLITLCVSALVVKARGFEVRKFAGLKPAAPILIVASLFLGIGFSLAFNSFFSLPGLEALQDSETALAQSLLFGSIFTAIVASTIVPIAEEIVFRGFMLNDLRRGWSLLFSVIVSSLIFGVLHGTAVWALFAAVLGLLLAWIALRTRSIYPAIAAHVGINGASFTFVWTQPHDAGIFALMLVAGLGILAISSIVVLVNTRPLSELESAPEPLLKKRWGESLHEGASERSGKGLQEEITESTRTGEQSMNIDRVIVGDIKTNTWLIEGIPTEAGQTPPLIVIDPGDEAEKILDAIAGRPVAAVMLTHGHFDHIGAADEVADESSSYLYMSEAELNTCPQLVEDIEQRYGIKVDIPRVDFKVKDGDVFDLAGLKVEVMLIPGHTQGSVGYVISAPGSEQKHFFSGDTLFARDVGRTDLLGGDQAAMEQSIERIASELAPSAKVYPGHGPATSIEREAAANSWWPS